MARPQPIILPGPSGMGENSHYSNFELIPKEVGMAILGEILGAITRNREGGAIKNLLMNETRPPNAEGPTIANAEVTAPQAGVRDKYAGMSKSDLSLLKPLIGKDLEQAQSESKAVGLLRALSGMGGEAADPAVQAYIKANPAEGAKWLANRMLPLTPKEQAELEHTKASTAKLQERPFGFMSGKEGGVYRTNPLTGEVATAVAGTPNADLSYHVEDRPLQGNRIQKYRIFTNKMGDVVKEEKLGEAYTPSAAAMMGSNLIVPNTAVPLGNGKWGVLQTNTKSGELKVIEIPGGGPTYDRNVTIMPPGDRENINQLFNSWSQLDTMEKALPQTGRISGTAQKGLTWAGLGSKEAEQFQAARNNFKLAAQSMIKGIPSNFDVQTVIDTLPDLSVPESVNKTRMAASRKIIKNIVAGTISYYKGMNYDIPPYVVNNAKRIGVDINKVDAWDGTNDPFANVISNTNGSKDEPIKPSAQSGTLNVGRFKVEVH